MEKREFKKGDIVAWEVNEQGEQAVCVATTPDWFDYSYNHDANGEMFIASEIPNDKKFVEPSVDTLKKFIQGLHDFLSYRDEDNEMLSSIIYQSPFKIYDGRQWTTSLFHNEKPETFCRKTGIKDANGTDIYEGDIIVSLNSSIETYITKVVLYNDECAAMSVYWLGEDKTDLCCNLLYLEQDDVTPIVIGNIHDDSNVAKTLREGLEQVGVKFNKKNFHFRL